MSTKDFSNYTLQTGIWNAPQVIPFDSLFDTYSVKNIFEIEANERITSVVEMWKSKAVDHLDYLKSTKRAKTSQPTFEGYISNIPEWSTKFSIRTAHVTHPSTPSIIYKSCRSLPGRGHPMANILRTPMAHLVEKAISRHGLTEMGVAKKGVLPIVSREEIEKLNEQKINEAFITCVQKMDVWDTSKTIEKIKEMSQTSQERLATQTCTIPKETGLGDFWWNNLQLHRENGKLYVLDTEPLYGELFIDKFGLGFEVCADMIADDCNLSSRAKFGLSEFKLSSEEKGLEIFQNTAQSFLEKIN